MKKLIYLLLCVFAISCTKEATKTDSESQKSSDRLNFRDFKEFHETSKNLANMRSLTDMQFWAQERNHSTLLFTADTNLVNVPPAMRTILNKDYEFQMGDSIVWFHSLSGNLYTFAKNSEYIDNLKAHPEGYRRSGYFTSRIIRSVAKTDVPLNGMSGCYITPNWQHWYYQPCGGALRYVNGGTKKWVVELRDYTGFYGYWESTLYVVAKLEWRSSRTPWTEASEERDLIMHISGDLFFINPPNIINIPLVNANVEMTCANGYGPVAYNQWINIGHIMGYPMSIDLPTYWQVNVSGTVYQHILGNYTDTYDPYTEYVYW